MACWLTLKVAMGTLACLGSMIGLRNFMGTKWAKNGAGVDKTDCYFDPECHPKADWEKVGEMKKTIFAELELLKQDNDVEGGKNLLQQMHAGFAEAGVPEDRIDYILTKWVEYAYPQLLDSLTKLSITVSGFGCANGYGQDLNQEYVYKGASKDGRPVYRGTANPDRYIYYDSYCADDTREPRWLLGGEPDVGREFNLNTHDGEGCDNDFSIVSDSKHLPGGQQKLAWNWCGDHGLHSSESVSIIYEIKGKAAAMPKEFEQAKESDVEDDKCSKYQTWGEKAVEGCHGCAKWYPGRVDGCMKCGGTCAKKCPPGSSSECYTSEEFVSCHKKCMYTDREEDREDDECSKYEKWGEMAVQGCHGCAKWYSGRVDGCMNCGDACKAICPAGSKSECYSSEEFVNCHKNCMRTDRATSAGISQLANATLVV